MHLIKNKSIAIIGGGPGGLTLARLLQMKGADVKVYERDKSREVRVQGATLDLHEDSGLAALEAAGLMPAFEANYRPGADHMRIVDAQANIIFDEEETPKAYHRPEIDRGPLRSLLLDSLTPDTVEWDSYLSSVEPLADGWQLNFQQNKSSRADLVIAADGANSKIRSVITSIQPFFAGVTIVEGSVYNAATAIPAINTLVKGGKVFAMGNEQTLILSSKGDGSITFYIGFKSGADWHLQAGNHFSDKASACEWFKQNFSEWNLEYWLPLFEQASYPMTIRPQYCMPVDQNWDTISNITMLGDAAHLMPPYAGEGVNMAMQDALELSHCLTSEEFSDLRSAIQHYETEMRIRIKEIATLTLEQTAALHSENALAHLIGIMS